MSENAAIPEKPLDASQNLLAELVEAVNKPQPEKPPPRARKLPTPNHHLVAFVDILGFSDEIAAATTPETLKRVHEKLVFVQQEFEKPSAVEDTAEQATFNANYGKRVIAL